jgi:hypothetical protein
VKDSSIINTESKPNENEVKKPKKAKKEKKECDPLKDGGVNEFPPSNED